VDECSRDTWHALNMPEC